MRLDPVTHAVVVPAGVTGTVISIAPATRAVTVYPGFAHGDVHTGHNDGATSVDFDATHLYVADRTSLTIDLVDRATKRTLSQTHLAARSDYVRVVPSVHELWVTEPHAQTIEVFDLATLARKTTIAVPGGPEALEIDAARGVAYTNVWTGARTWSISLSTHSRVANWVSGCPDGETQGIAVDLARGHLFIGCEGGTVTALDVAHGGRLLGTTHVNGEVDIVSMDLALHHVYVPSETGTLAIVGAAANGALTVLGQLPAVHGAHCVIADQRGHAWVCDPEHGRVLDIADPFPATR